jgi:hypothetical protein
MRTSTSFDLAIGESIVITGDIPINHPSSEGWRLMIKPGNDDSTWQDTMTAAGRYSSVTIAAHSGNANRYFYCNTGSDESTTMHQTPWSGPEGGFSQTGEGWRGNTGTWDEGGYVTAPMVITYTYVGGDSGDVFHTKLTIDGHLVCEASSSPFQTLNPCSRSSYLASKNLYEVLNPEPDSESERRAQARPRRTRSWSTRRSTRM